MNTRYWPAGPDGTPLESDIAEAAEALRAGEVVAIPTETVYGLAANALDDRAVAGIFRAKGRPADNPLIVHIADRRQLDDWTAQVPPIAEKLMAAYWPGPLTLILPVRPGRLSPRVTAGLDTVAVRMPDHPAALKILSACGRPLAAPSANRSGKPSPTDARHVLEDMAGRIYGVLDGGAATIGLESTVVELRRERLHILRPGAVSAERLRLDGFDVETRSEDGEERELAKRDHPSDEQSEAAAGWTPRAPGMKYAHYAPEGRMMLAAAATQEAVDKIRQALKQAKARGEVTGVLAFSDHLPGYEADLKCDLGSDQNLHQAANRLYDALRSCDRAGVTFIVAETCPEEGIGKAVMNRLRKASSGQILR